MINNVEYKKPNTRKKNQCKRRVLFVGNSLTLAHVGRPLILAKWAREAGYEVYFACGKSLAQLPQQEEIKTFLLPMVTQEEVIGRMRLGQFFYTKEELTQFAKAERKLITHLD